MCGEKKDPEPAARGQAKQAKSAIQVAEEEREGGKLERTKASEQL